MNFRAVAYLISFMLMILAVAMLLCAGVAWLYNDSPHVIQALMISFAIVFLLGFAGWYWLRDAGELRRRDGFGIVTFGWIAAALAAALPYFLSGMIEQPVSAVFEAMSGLTTTGASVLTDIESLPRGLLFWRALTHFFGGMGVLILCVAIIPFLGVGGMQIYRAEMPGPSKDRLAPRITTTAKLLWAVYVLLCLTQTLLLHIGGMSWFDSFCHAFSTMATGGFSTRTASIGAYNNLYIEIITIVFMFLAGVNFALHYRALTGDPRAYFRNAEFRFYCGLWLSVCLLLSFFSWLSVYEGAGRALRAGFFQGTSILTTTGFVTEDFSLWPAAAQVILVLIMFIGGCAGSTGGGMKQLRIMVVLKKTLREITLFMRPQSVVKTKIGNLSLPASSVSNISGFFILFLMLFAAGTLIMTFFTPDITTALTSVIATMGNIGPGLGAIGPVETYASIPETGKGVLVVFMLLGRLELFTVLIILLPEFWRK